MKDFMLYYKFVNYVMLLIIVKIKKKIKKILWKYK